MVFLKDLFWVPYYSIYTQLRLRKHKVRYHKFAGDLQIYVFFDPSKPGDRERSIFQIEKCIAEVSACMFVNKLKLNLSKNRIYFSSVKT